MTIQEAWALFLKQNKKCAYSGIPLQFPSQEKNHDGTASIDRIDSNGDYTIDNVQWVHKDINFMKQVFSEKQFLDYCVSICKYRNLV